jgi:hypothetical protein
VVLAAVPERYRADILCFVSLLAIVDACLIHSHYSPSVSWNREGMGKTMLSVDIIKKSRNESASEKLKLGSSWGFHNDI